MAEFRNGVVVTDEMITAAADVGDLELLREWGRQGMRVKTVTPLMIAATDGGSPEVLLCLVRELGADVNQATVRGVMGAMRTGATPLIAAAQSDNLAAVQCLLQLGANIDQGDEAGFTALFVAAAEGNLAVVRCLVEAGAGVEALGGLHETALLRSAYRGRFKTMQYLLEEAGADMDQVDDIGKTVWDMLIERFEQVAAEDDDEVEADAAALTALLRVMVLRTAPPPALVALLSPEPARVVQEGARLRARLPAYLVQRRALLDAHCPLLLPPLRALVHGYMELTNIEEIWATRLGVVA
jgi:hypothetical protein